MYIYLPPIHHLAKVIERPALPKPVVVGYDMVGTRAIWTSRGRSVDDGYPHILAFSKLQCRRSQDPIQVRRH